VFITIYYYYSPDGAKSRRPRHGEEANAVFVQPTAGTVNALSHCQPKVRSAKCHVGNAHEV
jgi:hypothetical protein